MMLNKTLALAACLSAVSISLAADEPKFEFTLPSEPFSFGADFTMSGRRYQTSHLDFARYRNAFNTGQDITFAFTTGTDLDTHKPISGFTARWVWQSPEGFYGQMFLTGLSQDNKKTDFSAGFGFGYKVAF